MESLHTLYARHTGKVSHRWALYLDVYESVLAPWRAAALDLVEVGVQNGGSLEIWGRYFPNATSLIGCDIDERCGALRFDDPRISIVVGPINSPATAREIAARADGFDIFIDDGSHVSQDIVAAFCNYFPRLRPGGVYLAEDLHCAYHRKWQGGIDRPNAMGFFAMLVDGIHHEYWKADASIDSRAAPFLPAGAKVDIARLAADVASIAFHDSLCVVHKRPADGRGRLGRRVIVGHEAAVDADPLAIREREG